MHKDRRNHSHARAVVCALRIYWRSVSRACHLLTRQEAEQGEEPKAHKSDLRDRHGVDVAASKLTRFGHHNVRYLCVIRGGKGEEGAHERAGGMRL